MKRINQGIAVACITGLSLLLAVACGGGDDAKQSMTTGSGESDVAAGQPAKPAATPTTPTTPTTPEPAAAASASSDAQSCLALAKQLKWAEALEPCTKAARELPDDLAIEHALQQAQAAAKDQAAAGATSAATKAMSDL